MKTTGAILAAISVISASCAVEPRRQDRATSGDEAIVSASVNNEDVANRVSLDSEDEYECQGVGECDKFAAGFRDAFIRADKWCWAQHGPGTAYTACITPMRDLVMSWMEVGMCADSTELDDLL